MTQNCVPDDDALLMARLRAEGVMPCHIAIKFEVSTDDVYRAIGLQRTYHGVRWSKEEIAACEELIRCGKAEGLALCPKAISTELEKRFGRSFNSGTVSRRIRGVTKPPKRAYCRRDKTRLIWMAKTNPKMSMEDLIKWFTRTTGKPLYEKTARSWMARKSLTGPMQN